jgi:uncharacterized DUF497 family protein
MRIVWDEPKRRTNLAKHGFDFADLSLDFFDGAFVRATRVERAEAVGPHGQHVITVVFARLGSEAISVISMRRASRQERRAYEAKDTASH